MVLAGPSYKQTTLKWCIGLLYLAFLPWALAASVIDEMEAFSPSHGPVLWRAMTVFPFLWLVARMAVASWKVEKIFAFVFLATCVFFWSCHSRDSSLYHPIVGQVLIVQRDDICVAESNKDMKEALRKNGEAVPKTEAFSDTMLICDKFEDTDTSRRFAKGDRVTVARVNYDSLFVETSYGSIRVAKSRAEQYFLKEDGKRLKPEDYNRPIIGALSVPMVFPFALYSFIKG